MADTDTTVSTAERLLIAAQRAFAERGYEATSLDDVAVDCDVRKQTLLYHYPSKQALLSAVIDRTVEDLAARIMAALPTEGDPRPAVVDELFRVGSQRPELLELFREALRLGPPASTRLLAAADPWMDRLETVVSRDRILGATAMILGLATEVDVLVALGQGPGLAWLRRRRRAVLDDLDT